MNGVGEKPEASVDSRLHPVRAFVGDVQVELCRVPLLDRRAVAAHYDVGRGAVVGGLAAFALARTAGRTQLEATIMRRAKLRKVHALLERRGFLAIPAARLMPGVPATGLHYVAGVAPVGVPAFAAAMALGALVRTAPYAVLGQGIGWGRSPRS